MTRTLQMRLIQETEEFSSLREDWDALLARNPVQTVFLTWEWLYAWWLHRRGQAKLWLITAWDGETLVGIAPLMLERRKKLGTRQRVLCSLGTPDMDVSAFIVCDGASEIYAALAGEIRRQAAAWDVLEVNEFDGKSNEISALQSVFRDYACARKDNSHYYLPQQENWEAYQKSLSQNARGDARRRLRRLQENFKVAFIHHRGAEINWQDMETIFALNEHGRYPHLYRPDSERAFQRRLLELTSAQGWPEVFLLYLDEQPAAYRYGFTFANRFEDWRNGIDMRLSEHAAGKALLWLTLENCIQRGLSEVDFLRGDENYKARWQTEERIYTQLRFVSRTRLLALLNYIWLPRLKQFIRRQHRTPQKDKGGQ